MWIGFILGGSKTRFLKYFCFLKWQFYVILGFYKRISCNLLYNNIQQFSNNYQYVPQFLFKKNSKKIKSAAQNEPWLLDNNQENV